MASAVHQVDDTAIGELAGNVQGDLLRLLRVPDLVRPDWTGQAGLDRSGRVRSERSGGLFPRARGQRARCRRDLRPVPALDLMPALRA